MSEAMAMTSLHLRSRFFSGFAGLSPCHWRDGGDFTGLHRGEAFEHIAKIIIGVDPLGVAAVHDRIHYRAVPACVLVPNEQPVFPAQRSGTNRILHQIVVHLDASVAQKHRQRLPARQRIPHGNSQPRTRRVFGVLFQPHQIRPQPRDDRCRLLLAHRLTYPGTGITHAQPAFDIGKFLICFLDPLVDPFRFTEFQRLFKFATHMCPTPGQRQTGTITQRRGIHPVSIGLGASFKIGGDEFQQVLPASTGGPVVDGMTSRFVDHPHIPSRGFSRSGFEVPHGGFVDLNIPAGQLLIEHRFDNGFEPPGRTNSGWGRISSVSLNVTIMPEPSVSLP